MRPSRLLLPPIVLLVSTTGSSSSSSGSPALLADGADATSALHAAAPSPPPPLKPWWPWSWKTLPVWGSGQGSSDFSPGAAKLLAKYPVTWTQGQQFPGACKKAGAACTWSNCTGSSGFEGWARCKDSKPGYANTENCTASDAAKVHAIDPSTFVGAYTGFYGCCTGYYSWWWDDFNSSKNEALWFTGDDGKVCYSDTDHGRGPIYDLCNPDMIRYYQDTILGSFVDPSAKIAGVFFDEVDRWVMPHALDGSDFMGCKVSTARKAKAKTCWVDAMQNITRFLASKGKYAIMSIKSVETWPDPTFHRAQAQVLAETKAFYFNEFFCPAKDKFASACKSRERCCIDDILTAADYARAGIPTMVHTQVANETDPNFDFLRAVFLVGAEPYSYVAMGTGWMGVESSFPWFKAYDEPLGAPLGPMTVINESLGIFTREFEHVSVTVNVSAWQGSVTQKAHQHPDAEDDRAVRKSKTDDENLAGVDASPAPEAVVNFTQTGLRVTVLSEGLMRLQWNGGDSHADETMDDRPTLQVVNRRILPVAKFSSSVHGGSLHVATTSLSLTVNVKSSAASASFICTYGSEPMRSHNETFAAGKPPAPPHFPTLINSEGMYLMHDGPTHRITTEDDAKQPWLDKTTAQPSNLDVYFFCYGSDYKKGLSQLASITGRAPLMPHAAYGVWWCQCCPAYTSHSFEQEILAEYANHSLPLTVAVLDMDWHVGGSEAIGKGLLWNSYTWDKTLFADHADFVKRLKSGGTPYGKSLKLAMNIHPGSYEIYQGPDHRPEHANEDNYAAFSRAMGVDPAENRTFGCNLYDRNYTTALTTTMLDVTGMDYYWVDCYSCTWQSGANRSLNDYGDGGSCGDGVSQNVEANLWSQLAFNDHRQDVTKERPLTLNRLPGVSPSNVHTELVQNPVLTTTAALAGHRYPAAWTGDVSGSYESLQAHVELFPAASATMLYPFFSADLGGFQPASSLTPERYVRWLQWAIWTPIFRSHGSGNNDKRIWSPRFATVYDELADAMRMRGAIMPWLYTLAYRNHLVSEPFIRPLWFDWPALPGAPGDDGPSDLARQFLFGDAIVHPITRDISEPHGKGCSVPDSTKEECGVPGITEARCVACDAAGKDPARCKRVGCCWDTHSSLVAGTPWCYFNAGNQSKPGAHNTSVRVSTFLPARCDGRAWVHMDGRPDAWMALINASLSTIGATSGVTAVEDFALGAMPVYVPESSVFPLQTLESTTLSFSDPVVWTVVMPLGVGVTRGGFDMYEDDGVSLSYKIANDSSRAWTNTSFVSKRSVGTLELIFRANATVGSFDGIPSARRHWLQLRPAPEFVAAKLTCNGTALTPLSSGSAPQVGSWWICGGGTVEPSMACPEGAMQLACPPSPNSRTSEITASFQLKD